MTTAIRSTRPKLLFFTPWFPYPMDSGGRIRTGKILEHSRDLLDITLVCPVVEPREQQYVAQADKLCSQFIPVPGERVIPDRRKPPLRIAAELLSPYPASVLRCYSSSFRETIQSTLRRNRFDLIVCDFLYPSLNLEVDTDRPTLLSQHNVESNLLKQYYKREGNPFMKLYWFSQWRKMVWFETRACGRFDAIMAISETDKAMLAGMSPDSEIHVVPIGVDSQFYCPTDTAVRENSLLFTGSLHWKPNEDGLLYFAKHVLGKIKESIADLTVTVVGRHPTDRLLKALKRYPEIRCIPDVSDIRPYMNSHAVFIIPLRIGGGVRLKVYEAMAMGKPVVSTPVGIEGLPVEDQRHLLVAKDPESFASSVLKLLSNAEMRRCLGQAAREFVTANCGWDRPAKVFAKVCHRIAQA